MRVGERDVRKYTAGGFVSDSLQRSHQEDIIDSFFSRGAAIHSQKTYFRQTRVFETDKINIRSRVQRYLARLLIPKREI